MSTCAARCRWLRSIAMGPSDADDAAVSAEQDRLPHGADAHRKLRERVRVADARRIVRGHDVVRLSVVGIDPHAGCVDVAERRLERRLAPPSAT